MMRARSSPSVTLVLHKDRAADVDAYEWAAQTTREFEGRVASAFEAYRQTLLDAAEAIPDNSPLDLLHGLPWQEAENGLLASWTKAVKGVVLVAGRRAGEELANPTEFLLDNPYTAKWLIQHGSERVTGIGDQTKEAIREEIRRGVDQHRTVRDTAVDLRGMIGLSAPQAEAWSRRRAALAEDYGPARAEQMSQAYARRLLRRRALNISATETVDAMNAGQHAAWQVARDTGHLPSFARRKWITGLASDRACVLCLAFKGVTTTMDAPFTSRTGVVRMRPTAHTLCRCTVGITYDRHALHA